jgi:hypothetical protein
MLGGGWGRVGMFVYLLVGGRQVVGARVGLTRWGSCEVPDFYDHSLGDGDAVCVVCVVG